jgi:drug/metabolite transporter (DMT)-like permease
MSPNAGELAALLTAFCYSISSIFFTTAGKIFGPLISNRLRLVIAVLLLLLIHWIAYGSPLPLNAGIQRWFWLGLSGIVGLALGDFFLFRAYVEIGPRLGLLFLSLSPAIATVLAWLFLGEKLNIRSIAGIVITLAGIIWVVLESNNQKTNPDQNGHIIRNISLAGIVSGILAASGQAFGVVLAKNGLVNNFPALSGNVIRMSAAFLALWILALIQRQVITTVQKATDQPSGMLYILGGAFFGPLIGVSFSLFAIQHTSIGIASTIIALPPIFLLPIGHFFFKEHITSGAVTGTILAIFGVGLLFWQ